MNKFIFVMMFSLVGCASNTGMRQQIDELQLRAHMQDDQIKQMEEKLAKLNGDQSSITKDDVAAAAKTAAEAAKNAYNWAVTQSGAAWNSETGKDYRERFQKCWNDLNKK